MNDKKNKILKSSLFILWISIVLIVVYFYLNSNLSFKDYLFHIQNFIQSYGYWGPLILILLSVIRPLIFFPATILTIASGALFGNFLGFIYIMIGENLSANLSYIVGKYFGGHLPEKFSSKNKMFSKMDCKFRENGFFTVFTMRLIYFPFDFVGYLSGMCKIKQKEFALGTFIGIIPGVATFIFLGSSFFDPVNLIFATLFFIIGLIISKYLKKKNTNNNICDLNKNG